MTLHRTGFRRLVFALGLGLIAGAVSLVWWPAELAILVTTAVLGLSFVISTIIDLRRLSADNLRDLASSEDFHPELEEVLVVLAAFASLAGFVWLLLSKSGSQITGGLLALIALASSWLMLHTMYAIRYAHLYYEGDEGGLDFNTKIPPIFTDFAYFAFTLGMSFAVSDVNVSTTKLRGVIIRHALLSYLFGTLILASTVNLVASILTSQ